ncbi:Peptidoglycan-binding protein ArfA [Pirellulimonas nuda]|uniref:Peptidoglycan-binding protein ArfA n=1 Tax=Pirellulimonas nuda TaxID=2528009 RepID=A0A518D9F1_9BACT|nr:OmpA family protein [Pirellulimonas nuda]QDU88068.1 Peptidoglycan-binding protein ArfA [Pirellulimonas nuda]
MFLRVAISVCFTLTLASGCGRVVFRPQGPQPVALSPEQQQQLALQSDELRTRATDLDRDNQELETLLAESRQQAQLLQQQMTATQDQLRATADQLAAAQMDNSKLSSRTQALTASTQVPSGGATIRANSTLMRPLSVASLPGVEVRQDGDVIRVSIASDQLFSQGDASLQTGAEPLLQNVTVDVLRAYPEQRIGIEGHTDGGGPPSGRYASAHHLSVAQATAVYDVMRRSGQAPEQQLFVIGYGANHPIVSNATEAGRAKNRRIELVIYPESFQRR